MAEKIAQIGGWALLLVAFACIIAGWVSPQEEWRAWALPACTLLIGGLGMLVWGYHGVSLSLKE